MKILLLLWLVTTVYCGVQHHEIIPFANSTEPQKITVKVRSTNTSVLMYYLGDVTIEDITDESNRLIICTEEMFVQNLCDDTGTFIIENNENVSIVNTFLEGGGNISLPVERGGLYHVILFQEVNSLNDYSIVESHSYGFLPLERREYLRILMALIIFLGITLIIFMKIFDWKKGDNIGSLFRDFIAILVLEIGTVSLNILHLSVGYWKEEPLLIFRVLHFFGGKVYDLFVLGMLYKWSWGIFGYDRHTMERLVLQPGFKNCLSLLMISTSILGGIKFELFGNFPKRYLRWVALFFRALKGISTFITWIIVYRNSKSAEKKLPDKRFAKNYGYLRLGFLILPVLIACMAFLTTVVLGAMEILAIGHVDQISDPNIVFSIITNLDQFFMPIMFWFFFFIWKRQKVDSTGFDNEVKHD